MAERPATRSRRFSRDELARAFPDPRLRAAFEGLSADVAEALPAAVQRVGEAAEAAQADAAQAPPVLHAPASDDPDTEIAALREEVALLRTRIDALEQQP